MSSDRQHLGLWVSGFLSLLRQVHKNNHSMLQNILLRRIVAGLPAT